MDGQDKYEKKKNVVLFAGKSLGLILNVMGLDWLVQKTFNSSTLLAFNMAYGTTIKNDFFFYFKEIFLFSLDQKVM